MFSNGSGLLFPVAQNLSHVCLVETLMEGLSVAGLQRVLKMLVFTMEMVNSLIRQHSAYISIPNVSLLRRFLTYSLAHGPPLLHPRLFQYNRLRGCTVN